MKVVILTSSMNGTLAHHLPFLLKSKSIEIKMVVVSEGLVANKNKLYKKKLKKILSIGVLGAINGIRMRKWFDEDIKQHTTFIDLKAVCVANGISLKSTPSINCKETENCFREANADIGLSLGNGYIAKRIFSIPSFGMLNIHHEVLPDYQNAQSVIWQLYNGSTTTGFTIHKIDEHIDTGAILYQEKINIEIKNTLGETVSATIAKLYDASAKALVNVLENFAQYNSVAKLQGNGVSYTTPSIWKFIKMNNQFKKIKRNNSK